MLRINKFGFGVGVILAVFSCGTAWSEGYSFYAANTSNWEKNSKRPIRINLTIPATKRMLGLDAYIKYDNTSFNTPTLLKDNVTDMTSDHKADFSPTVFKFSYHKGEAQAGWPVAGNVLKSVFEAEFTIKTTAVAGPLNWDSSLASGSDTGAPPADYSTSAGASQTITITENVPPVWSNPAGIVKTVDKPGALWTGNVLKVTWDKSEVTDDTPYGITVDNYDQHNLVFKIYRRPDDGLHSLKQTTGPGVVEWLDGNNEGKMTTGIRDKVDDGIKDTEETYWYRVRALDNTLTPLEDQNQFELSKESHDFVAPIAPTLITKNVQEIAENGGQPFMFAGETWTKITNFVGYLPGDQKVTLHLNKDPGAATVKDYGGCINLQNNSNDWAGVALQSATGNNNGKKYELNETIGTARVIDIGDKSVWPVTGLTNSDNFYFKVYNYDGCEQHDGAAFVGEQGRNYSGSPAITAIPGIPPHNITNIGGAKTSDGLQVSWTNPNDAWYGGGRVVVKEGSYPSHPGDIGASGAIYEFTGEPGADKSHLFPAGSEAGQLTDPVGKNYQVTIFTHNNLDDIAKRRYSSGVQLAYDANPPGPVQLLFGLPAGQTSALLSWLNPGDADLSGTIILRKKGSKDFKFTNFPINGKRYTAGDVIDTTDADASEIVAFVGENKEDTFNDTGLTPNETYYYRAWAIDTSRNYSGGYDLTGSIPGGGVTIGGGGFIGSLKGATTDKLTFNTVFLPRDGITAQVFVNSVFEQTGCKVLAIYGWENGQSVGITVADAANVPAFDMIKGVGYQVYVDRDSTAELDTNKI
ncbi:MAG: hypothetical protein ABIH50_01125 [bacterium]